MGFRQLWKKQIVNINIKEILIYLKHTALKFLKFLKKISVKTSQEQHFLLKEEFNSWKGAG
jgi:hypothetical protein